MEPTIEELLTSFSNPNYGLGCDLAELQIHSGGRIGSGANNNNDITEHNGAGNDCVFADPGEENPGEVSGWQQDTASSGDSAISSPTTESGLASPMVGLIDSTAACNGAVKSEAEPQGVCTGNENDVTALCATETHGENEKLTTISLHQDVLTNSSKVGDACVNNGADKTTSSNLSSDVKSNQAMRLVLPAGWQQCEDADGAYYWHVKSGTLQRDPPENSCMEPVSNVSDQKKSSSSEAAPPATDTETLAKPDLVRSSPVASQEILTTTSSSSSATNRSNAEGIETSEFPIRYAVRSLGWVEIGEQELTQERSSRAVNKAIVDLSVGRRDLNDAVGRWGDGKYLYMDVDQENLSLISPGDLTVLNVQPIRTIRVWGVGRDNGRDFAYVARDRASRRYMCHVFRCDQPARTIASTLCEICKRAVAQRAGASAINGAAGSGGAIVGRNHAPLRPTDLPNLTREGGEDDGTALPEAAIKYDALLKNASFPTPMDEPRKLMNCHYLGTILVTMPTGVEILNGAIDVLNARVPAEKWTYVDVTVAPSTITIAKHENPDEVLAECRVRFLSFLGISVKNTRLCSFIMHTAQDQFNAHVFYCEPSAGALCKTIEAACKLRYQKCLDKSLSGSALTSPIDQSRADTDSNGSNKAETHEINSAGTDSNLSPSAAEPGIKSSLLARTGSLRSGVATSAQAVRLSLSSTAQTVKESVGGMAGSVKDGLSTAVEGVSSEVVVSAIGSVASSVKGGVSYAAGSARDGIAGVFNSFRRKAGGYFGRSIADERDGAEEGEGGCEEPHRKGSERESLSLPIEVDSAE